MWKRNYWILYALLVLLPACQSGCARFRASPRNIQLAQASVELPVRWWCDFAMCEVYIGGQGPFAFLLDTGAGRVVVDRAIAERFPSSVFDYRARTGGSTGRKTQIGQAMRLGELRAGDVSFHDLDAYVLDLSELSDVLGTDLDGILGIPAFRGLLLTIDYPAHTVRVSRDSLPARKSEGVFTTRGSSRPHAPLTIDGETIPVLIDTGSTGGLDITRDRFVELDFARPPVDAAASMGVANVITVEQAGRLAGNTRLGPHLLVQPIVEATGSSGSRVGVGLLRHFVLSVDIRNHRARLERATQGPIVTPPQRTLGLVLGRGGPDWTVRRILPFGAGAQAGLRADDRIVAINGRSVAELDCQETRRLELTEDTLTLDVRRGDRVLQVRLPIIETVP